MAFDSGRFALDQARSQIGREILRIHEESYGVGASQVAVHIEEDIVLVVIDGELTILERTLLEAGKRDVIRSVRRSYQEAIAPTFTAVVERATGRKVESFLSEMSVDPIYSIEFFRLAPAAREDSER
jgi:uncharacterized protein YbcI